MVLQRFNGSLIIFSIIMLDSPRLLLSQSTWSLLCWMGRGDHPQTILLVALYCQSNSSWLKERFPAVWMVFLIFMITTPTCESSSQTLRSQSLVPNLYFHCHPFQSCQNIHNLFHLFVWLWQGHSDLKSSASPIVSFSSPVFQIVKTTCWRKKNK